MIFDLFDWQSYSPVMQGKFSFFDDEKEYEKLIGRSKTDNFESADTNEIYVYCKNCQRTHRWLECSKRQIN